MKDTEVGEEGAGHRSLLHTEQHLILALAAALNTQFKHEVENSAASEVT
jgi:hypothetical protein